MKFAVVTPPTEEPLTLAEARSHLRVDDNTEDALITSLIKRARLWAEEESGRAFVTQTIRLYLDAFPVEGERAMRLPRPKCQSVTSVSYVDEDGATQTLGATEWQADLLIEPAEIREAFDKTWPATRAVPNAVTVEYVAGYGAASAVDERAKQAMLLMIGHWFANREEVGPSQQQVVEAGARALLAQIWHGFRW